MDRRHAACCIRGMRCALLLLAVSTLPGCAYYGRTPQPTAVAPGATIYPAPAAGQGRYLPWLSAWSHAAPMAAHDGRAFDTGSARRRGE